MILLFEKAPLLNGGNFLPGGHVAAETVSEKPIPPHRASWLSSHADRQPTKVGLRAVYHGHCTKLPELRRKIVKPTCSDRFAQTIFEQWDALSKPGTRQTPTQAVPEYLHTGTKLS